MGTHSPSALGQFEPEAAALPWLGFDPSMPAHPLGPFAHDRQADAGAGISRGTREPFENLKDSFLEFGRNADAVVFDPEAHPVLLLLFFGPNVDVRPDSGGDELNRIRDQVSNNLL